MTGYSVMTEPSSRCSVGTLPFGLMARNSGVCVSPPRMSSFWISNGLPISSSTAWMPMEQAPGA